MGLSGDLARPKIKESCDSPNFNNTLIFYLTPCMHFTQEIVSSCVQRYEVLEKQLKVFEYVPDCNIDSNNVVL